MEICFTKKTDMPPKPNYAVLTNNPARPMKEVLRREVKKMMKRYWWCSRKNAWELFDFERAFLGLAAQIDDLVHVYIDEILDGLTKIDFLDSSIFRNAIDISRQAYGYHSKLKYKNSEVNIVGKCNIPDNISLSDKIELMEKIIHLEHMGGSNIWGIDVEALRKELDNDIDDGD